ncbi:MAG: uroporphyrinogen decarboxylase family protein [Thermoproteota archaeon]
MNSRTRVLTTLRHEEPDRVPIDLGSMPSTGIMAIAYAKLKKHLGLKQGILRVYDVGQQLAEPEREIIDMFKVDVISLTRTLEPCGPGGGSWKEWVLPDGTSCEVPAWFNPEPDGAGGWFIKNEKGIVTSKMPRGSLYFDSIYHPLEKIETLEVLEDYDWEGNKVGDEYISNLRSKAEHLYSNTGFAIHFFGVGSVHEWGQGLRGWSNWLVDLSSRRSFASKMLDRMMDVLTHNLKKYVEALKDYVQIIGFGDDLGIQTGPQVSPKTYRELLKPCHNELFQYVKKHSKMFVFLHSCGSIYDLIPDLIDAGVDILNPVQISARNMEPERLKKEFGDQVTFWGGGVDTQNVLHAGKSEEVYEHVKKNILVFARNGGYVFNQVHNIQANVPPENIIAAYRSAYENGLYPLKS